MSHHIVTIDTPDARISCRKGQLTMRVDQAEPRSLPLEDIAAIIITSFNATVHSKLLIEAARHGIGFVICEQFRPVSILLPANRSSDTLLTKAHLALTDKQRQSLWRKTIDAKCRNQWSLAEQWEPGHKSLARLRALAHGRSQHKEAPCAQLYWRVFASAVTDNEFQRLPASSEGLNALLNFGYGVLLCAMLQKLLAYGLDPTFGIGHAIRERSTPLAYDLMEPFRPCVDARVAQWVLEKAEFQNYRITAEFRKWVTGFTLEKVGYFGLEIEIRHCLESVVRSFRNAVIRNRLSEYKPWTGDFSKWAGCS